MAQVCALGLELGQVVLMLLIHAKSHKGSAALLLVGDYPDTHGLSPSSLSSTLHSAQTLNKTPGTAGHPLVLGKGFNGFLRHRPAHPRPMAGILDLVKSRSSASLSTSTGGVHHHRSVEMGPASDTDLVAAGRT